MTTTTTKQNRIHPPFLRLGRFGTQRASSLVIVMLSMLVLGIAAARILDLSMQKAQAPTHALSWRYALAGAESGAQSARMALQTAATDPVAAWSDWSPSTATSWPKTKTFTLAPTGSDSERALSTSILVTIDAPASLNPVGSGSPWYRVRSTGTADMPATARTGTEGINLALRRMNFTKTEANPRPRISRTVETVLKPATPFNIAILANERIELKKGKTMLVDSWNSQVSGDPYAKLAYDVNKNGNGGNIATNSTGGKNGADKVIRLEQVYINGGVYKGGGVVETKSNVTIAGDIVDGFNQEARPPLIPDLTGYLSQASIQPKDAKGGLTLNASNIGVASYSFPELHIHDKDDKIIIKNPNPGQPAYINLYVAGKFKVHGSALITVDPKVYVNLYVGKDATVEQKGGNGGIDLGTDRAQFLQIYGVVTKNEADTGKTKKRKFKIKGNLTASIYAPTYEFEIKPKAGGADFYGSLVGRKFKIEGEQRVHYDESLTSVGPINGYSITSWIEDWVPQGKLAGVP